MENVHLLGETESHVWHFYFRTTIPRCYYCVTIYIAPLYTVRSFAVVTKVSFGAIPLLNTSYAKFSFWTVYFLLCQKN